MKLVTVTWAKQRSKLKEEMTLQCRSCVKTELVCVTVSMQLSGREWSIGSEWHRSSKVDRLLTVSLALSTKELRAIKKIKK